MKMRFLLLLPLALAACAQEPDTETAELSAYYARKGDQMTTTLQRSQTSDGKTVKPPTLDPAKKPKATY